MADSALDIAALLAELGFDSPGTLALARQALIDARLTHQGKSRIDAGKRSRVEELLDGRYLVTCGAPECARHAGGRTIAVASTLTRCRICHGSPNRRAVVTAAQAFASKGIQRIVVVGGSPAVHDELRQLAPDDWQLRIVDGTERRTLDAARADMKWAQLVLVWGSSELDHKVSTLYVREENRGGHVVVASRRGIAALLDAAITHVARKH